MKAETERIKKFRELAELIEDNKASSLVGLMQLQQYHPVLELKSFWYLLQSHPELSKSLSRQLRDNNNVPFVARKTLVEIAARQYPVLYLVYDVSALDSNNILASTLERYLGDDLNHLM